MQGQRRFAMLDVQNPIRNGGPIQLDRSCSKRHCHAGGRRIL